jgi:glycosyltransferase involved in cell wall biosynthesis
MKLSIYTNIPTPNQLDFFNAIADKFFDLYVVYYANRESNRYWELQPQKVGYKVSVIKDSILVKPILKKYISFHFSWSIFGIAWKDESPVIIVGGAYNTPNTIIAAIIGKIRGKKVAFFGERLYDTNNIIHYFFKRMALLPMKWTCDFFICVGNDAIKSYDYYGVKTKKFNLPYNIDIHLFKEKNLNKSILDEYKKQYKSKNETILLTSGSLIPRKGMDTLIKLMRRFSKEEFNIKLLILGEGPERAALEHLAEYDDRIVFLGFKEKQDIPYYFRVADLFLFASRYDGWGLVINEALAAGLPVVASTACRAANELIKHGVNGFLCDAEDIDSFEKYTKELLSNAELANNMREYNQNLQNQIHSGASAELLYEIVATHL